jgi:hypothetical protein
MVLFFIKNRVLQSSSFSAASISADSFSVTSCAG